MAVKANKLTGIFITNSNKTAGVMFVDIAGWLLSMVNPIIQSDEEINIEDGETLVVTTAIVNGSNTGLYPLILGPQVMQWFPVVIFRSSVPGWFPHEEVLLVNILQDVGFDTAGFFCRTIRLVPMWDIFLYCCYLFHLNLL